MVIGRARRSPSNAVRTPTGQGQSYMRQTVSGWRKGSVTAMVKHGEYKVKNAETGKFENVDKSKDGLRYMEQQLSKWAGARPQ